METGESRLFEGFISLHNSIKNNWTLEQLNWKLYDAGNDEEWDGLTGLFIELVNADKTLLEDSYIRKYCYERRRWKYIDYCRGCFVC